MVLKLAYTEELPTAEVGDHGDEDADTTRYDKHDASGSRSRAAGDPAVWSAPSSVLTRCGEESGDARKR